jgi:CHAD domain-containing protein
MAYELKGRKPVDAELSRIVGKEFDKARDELTGNSSNHNSDEAVHEARKSVKKIRAVLRLLQADLGKDYDNQNQRLRGIAHQLSVIRDVDATAEIFDAIRAHYPHIVSDSISTKVHEGLEQRRRATVASVHPDRLLPRAARALDESASIAKKQIRRVARRSSVSAGMLRGYRRARKAMADVHTHPDDAQFHTWRRRVKDHEYHVRLLERLSAWARTRAKQLNQLETWLGDDHNLVVMRSTLLDAPPRFGNTRATTLILGCMAKYQATLRRRALKLGDRLFTTKPKNFRQTIDRSLRAR